MRGIDVPSSVPKICRHKFRAENKIDRKLSNKLNFVLILNVSTISEFNAVIL